MIEIHKGILGPDAPAQFFPSNYLPRPFCERGKYLERLVLAAKTNTILAKFAGLQIQFEGAEADAGSSLVGHSHNFLGLFYDMTPQKVIHVDKTTSVLRYITLRTTVA
jgi:hypothetical protein